MRRYITHRVLQGIVTIWLVTLGVFSVLRLTGDPVSYMLPPDASKEDRARLIALYGFNDPLWKQYVVFNNNLLHGRFGPLRRLIRCSRSARHRIGSRFRSAQRAANSG